MCLLCLLCLSLLMWYTFTVSADHALRFRLDPKTRRLLDRLRDERHVNISSWARKHIQNAIRVEFPEEFQDHEDQPEKTGGETPEPQQPIPGWKPRKVGEDEAGRDVWGAALQGPEVARLPDELQGIQIIVTPVSTGVPWTTAITEVVSRSEEDVVVRHAGRPKR